MRTLDSLRRVTQRGAWTLALIAALQPVEVHADATPAQVSMTVRVLELTNLERVKAGLPPFTPNPFLTKAAQGYAEVLGQATCFEHTCGPVPLLQKRIENAGYTNWASVAENIAAGQQTPE